MEQEDIAIIEEVKRLTAEGSLKWKVDGPGLVGNEPDGTMYYLSTFYPERNLFSELESKISDSSEKTTTDSESMFVPELRILGNGETRSIRATVTQEGPNPKVLAVLRDLEKDIQKKIAEQHMFSAILPLKDEEFLQFINDLVAAGYLENHSTVKGISLQLLDKGPESLSGKQLSVFEDVVSRFILDNCEACGVPIPWSEKVAALNNGGFCSLHGNRLHT